MKNKKIKNKKLVLGKETVAVLNKEKFKHIQGGFVPPTPDTATYPPPGAGAGTGTGH